MIVSSAPGKIIVAGEYVGIFGEPVILTSINLRTTVSISQRNDNLIYIVSDRFPGERVTMNLSELRNLWNEAINTYKKYLHLSDTSLLKKYRSLALTPASLAIASALYSLKNNITSGIEVKINSILPVGSGLGSSASMCSSLIGGVLSYYDKAPDLEKLNEMTFKSEKVLNGKPSGADNSGVVYGGWLRFVREGEKIDIKRLRKFTQSNWWLINGGKPSETTLELIGRVLDLRSHHKGKINDLIRRDRQIIEIVHKQIEDGYLKPDFLYESQKILEEFGVIGEKGKMLINKIIESGGQAKVSGAGGISSGVGMIMCYHPDEEKLRNLALLNNFVYSPLVMGGEGWQIEK